ncbi:MAG: AMP-binding protein [Burkholderiaceae bacterium]|nr:AMP-binding protein [Burkholderiaceae bacterium]
MGTPVSADSLALQRFYRWERETPDQVAFVQPMGGAAVREFTWAQLAGETRRMAAHLQGLGFEPGARIAILSKNCAWWLMSDLAIWMAGYVSVPLYPTLAAETVRQILTHSESRACFVGKLDGWEAMKPGMPEGLPCIGYPLSPQTGYPGWDEIVARSAPLAGNPVRAADELCTLMYTSGTTGQPKGVMHSFATFAWSITHALKRIDIGCNDRLFSYLPLAHVAERMIVEHSWLAANPRIYFAESLETFADDLRRARPTVFFSVPRLWVKFQQGVHAKMAPQKLERMLGLPIIGALVRKKVLKALGLDACRYAAGGASPMPPELLKWYARLGLNLVEVYGMTENCGVSHATLPGDPRPGTVGFPYDGVEARIDPQSGEIQVRSAGMMLGYYKQPDLTRETFTADGWLKTGDKGALDPGGALRITGRVKDLFKTDKGKYVAPAPIEDRLVNHVAVEACVVAGANLGQPLGILMLAPDAAKKALDADGRSALQASFEAHLATVNAALDPHEQLAFLVAVATPWTVENGFVTPTMKVRRNRIEEVYAPAYAGWVAQQRKVIWYAA